MNKDYVNRKQEGPILLLLDMLIPNCKDIAVQKIDVFILQCCL